MLCYQRIVITAVCVCSCVCVCVCMHSLERLWERENTLFSENVAVKLWTINSDALWHSQTFTMKYVAIIPLFKTLNWERCLKSPPPSTHTHTHTLSANLFKMRRLTVIMLACLTLAHDDKLRSVQKLCLHPINITFTCHMVRTKGKITCLLV